MKTLQQLFEEYIDECQYTTRLRPETIKGYRAVFKHFSTMMPEVVAVEFLTMEMMNEFFKRIQLRERIVGKNTKKVGLNDSTIFTYGSKLNAFLEWLVRKNLLGKNPLDTIKLKRPEYTDSRALEKSDVDKIITAIALHFASPLMLRRDMAMVSLLLFCGLRAGEFISLKVQDVDMVKLELTVRGETSKSKKTRVLPVHPTLGLHLREYITERNKRGYKTEQLIVSGNEDKGLLSRHGLKHWTERMKRLSGVKFHLHQFRHSFACNLLFSGANIIQIQRLMGHADPKMTLAYLRSITTEDSQGIINKLTIDNLV
jgi:integrase